MFGNLELKTLAVPKHNRFETRYFATLTYSAFPAYSI
jgi:hypothetical protein